MTQVSLSYEGGWGLLLDMSTALKVIICIGILQLILTFLLLLAVLSLNRDAVPRSNQVNSPITEQAK
jgi:hypothetical protein